MLYGEIIAVCSEIHAERVNALWVEHRISVRSSWWYSTYIKQVLDVISLNRFRCTPLKGVASGTNLASL